jgi:NitT/TauT family transport system permease protein
VLFVTHNIAEAIYLADRTMPADSETPSTAEITNPASAIVTNTTRGLKATDRRVIEFMRSINARRSEILLKIQLPSALPFIFASFKIAASLALVGAVVAEFYSSDRGLGYLIITSATQLRTDLLFVAIVVLAALGVSSFMLYGYLERIATRGERTEETR